MVVVVFGSRTLKEEKHVAELIGQGLLHLEMEVGQIDKIIAGGAGGVDMIAGAYAKRLMFDFREYLADWGHCVEECNHKHRKTGRNEQEYCPTAGHRRNAEMCRIADAAIGIWDGKSTGTADMAKRVISKPMALYFVTTERA